MGLEQSAWLQQWLWRFSRSFASTLACAVTGAHPVVDRPLLIFPQWPLRVTVRLALFSAVTLARSSAVWHILDEVLRIADSSCNSIVSIGEFSVLCMCRLAFPQMR